MIYSKLTKKAMRIAFDAHRDQVDKTGLPYIFHPFHLAEQMHDEISTCVALLHDVIEDTPVSFEDLTSQGIPGAVIDTLRLLTHDDALSYMDYIHQIRNSGNSVAIGVKLADLQHNSDITRLDGEPDESMSARLEKYRIAINELIGANKTAFKVY